MKTVKNQTLEQVVPDYMETVIQNSWTWHRLTPAERARFENVGISKIGGTARQRTETLSLVYWAFLQGLGCDGWNWREPAPETF